MATRFSRWGLSCIALGWLVGCSNPGEASRRDSLVAASSSSIEVVVDRRIPALTNYPCSQCHADLPTNTQERKLDRFHTRIQLAHGPSAGWCYRCHAEGKPNLLRLPHGETVSFDDSYQLCGGCHGDELRDWRIDLHGRSTGAWNGLQHRVPCTGCHDPHHPTFPLMTPLPPPARPRARPALF